MRTNGSIIHAGIKSDPQSILEKLIALGSHRLEFDLKRCFLLYLVLLFLSLVVCNL